ncbi:hypothetical protein FKG94_07945 [Exilibacterium tricleocarpae]|uniref:Uncharacterized protein n=1 Tax=Exilibacterium tricleocarpae TaxID=2591008 RepID=A0A545TZK7_9GAMM|nr:hypothetical protein [Exilibacterium tricleocarpae]TQV82650.1 hypothetical protein FKG94_07945 [Exilibacterium tricleocarpae]
MNGNVSVDVDEVKRVYDLIERVHSFFHQPMNFPNVDEFAENNYKEISEIYYNVIWNWLPEDMKESIKNE